MEINNVLEKVASLLDLPDDVVSEESSDEKCLNQLVLAFNNVLCEVAEEYLPFYKTEKLVSFGGKIAYADFSERVYKIKGVSDQTDKKVKFKQKAEYLEVVEDGEYEITYTYLPKEVEFGGTVDTPINLSERTMAYGVAGEFALITGRYDDSVNYDGRFSGAISASRRGVKERRLPYRRCL